MLRHVEPVRGGHWGEGAQCPDRLRQVPSGAPLARRGQRRAESRGPRTRRDPAGPALEGNSVQLAEEPLEPDTPPEAAPRITPTAQPEDQPRLLPQGGLPLPLGLPNQTRGRAIPQAMVLVGHP